MNNPRLDFLREKAHKLPLLPGVYIMKDKTGKIIYIGKAKALKNRVSSYFRSVEKHQEKVYRMVENAYDFDFIVTDSEYEALVLECSLIKQNNPKYNILLKDGKGYSYIRISNEKFPRITAARQRRDGEGVFLGPYTSNYVVKESVAEVNTAFMLPTCHRRFPAEFGKGRPCLNYYIKNCIGLCRGKISEEEYAELIGQATDFLKTGSKQSVEKLTALMEQAAENLQFEKAARYRDRIRAIEKLGERQKVVMNRVEEQDVIAFATSQTMAMAVIIKYRGGKLVDTDDYLIKEYDDLVSARSEFITRYYYQSDSIPKQVTIDGEVEDAALLEAFLSGQAGRKVRAVFPQKGEQWRLCEMARNNAAEKLSHLTVRTGRQIATLDELGKLLGMPHPPSYIEAYDISNMGSDSIVGAMVVFENGAPLKSAYKKFSIKTTDGQDDYAAMHEMLSRRLQRYFEEKDSGEGFGRLPDLILLDGGKGHVGVILPLLEQLHLQVPVFGMVKDDRHRTRAIAKDGGEIAIASHKSTFALVTRIQDEVHRFAIGYHRAKHKNKTFSSALTGIPGIGEKRAKALMKHFRTIGAIKQADVSELAQAEGMSVPAAEAVWRHYHPETESAAQKNAEA